jgi:hypothetical protein
MTVGYGGDAVIVVGHDATLAATVMDSAAVGYAGPHPETTGATIGDITRANVAFAVYQSATCGSGSPVTTLLAAVSDGAPTGDGIGRASTTWTGAPVGSFCVIASVVGATAGAANDFYVATPAPAASLVVRSGDESQLTSLGDGHLWVGLRNSDDQGTQFDVRVELLRNGVPVAAGRTRCVTGLTRNAALAKAITVAWDRFDPITVEPNDAFAIAVSTRIGTNPNGTKCPGPGGSHNNAVGLRFYYDAGNRASNLASSSGWPVTDSFHSDGGLCDRPTATNDSQGVTRRFLDGIAPTATAPRCKDSGPLDFNRGNAFVRVGVWTLPPPVSGDSIADRRLQPA